MTSHPIAFSDQALLELMRLAEPLDRRDRRLFIEAVAKELNGHAEIDLGLAHRVGAELQRGYLSYVRGTGKARYR
jgi:hypothetical protein